MDRISLIEQIKRNDNLLSIPQVLSRILEEVGRDDVSPESLAKVILQDPNLTGRICAWSIRRFTSVLLRSRLSTSDFHSGRHDRQVPGALRRRCSTRDKVAAESGVDAKSFFAYELAIAAAAEQTAITLGRRNAEEAFIAGLLQDIGILFFLHHHPVEYRKIIDRKVKATTLIEAEREVFGIDHAEVGGYLADEWHLPDYVVSAIRSHHENGARRHW